VHTGEKWERNALRTTLINSNFEILQQSTRQCTRREEWSFVGPSLATSKLHHEFTQDMSNYKSYAMLLLQSRLEYRCPILRANSLQSFMNVVEVPLLGLKN
jgi:hypothetical protein